MINNFNPIPVKFFKLGSGREPARDWLKGLSGLDKKAIGTDIKTVQFGWPLGMPLVRKMDEDLWEIRTTLKDKIARVFFTHFESQIVLLHGFIKKGQKTPKDDLDAAKNRLKILKGGKK